MGAENLKDAYAELQQTLIDSTRGIAKRAEAIKVLLLDADEEAKMEHSKGMEGLVKEATKHVTKHVTTEAPASAELLGILILTGSPVLAPRRRTRRPLSSTNTARKSSKSLPISI